MNASDFVSELSSTAPSFESLRGIGLSAFESESFRAGYICLPRSRPLALIVTNEMLDLASRWDVSNIEVGMVRLSESPSAYQDRGIQVGLVEADPLVISKTNSEVVVEEAGTGGHLLWKVARSPGQFLDALVAAAKFLTDRTVGTVGFDDFDSAKETANKCAVLAGGDEYSGFYFMLLGAE